MSELKVELNFKSISLALSETRKQMKEMLSHIEQSSKSF